MTAAERTTAACGLFANVSSELDDLCDDGGNVMMTRADWSVVASGTALAVPSAGAAAAGDTEAGAGAAAAAGPGEDSARIDPRDMASGLAEVATATAACDAGAVAGAETAGAEMTLRVVASGSGGSSVGLEFERVGMIAVGAVHVSVDAPSHAPEGGVAGADEAVRGADAAAAGPGVVAAAPGGAPPRYDSPSGAVVVAGPAPGRAVPSSAPPAAAATAAGFCTAPEAGPGAGAASGDGEAEELRVLVKAIKVDVSRASAADADEALRKEVAESRKLLEVERNQLAVARETKQTLRVTLESTLAFRRYKLSNHEAATIEAFAPALRRELKFREDKRNVAYAETEACELRVVELRKEVAALETAAAEADIARPGGMDIVCGARRQVWTTTEFAVHYAEFAEALEQCAVALLHRNAYVFSVHETIIETLERVKRACEEKYASSEAELSDLLLAGARLDGGENSVAEQLRQTICCNIVCGVLVSQCITVCEDTFRERGLVCAPENMRVWVPLWIGIVCWQLCGRHRVYPAVRGETRFEPSVHAMLAGQPACAAGGPCFVMIPGCAVEGLRPFQARVYSASGKFI